jgi:RNA polymerase sigma-70 factor (ECF subfamily)
LCETYWYPLYAFLRSRGHSAEDAQDLTQAFFTRVLERRGVRARRPRARRFRSFLLASLKNFVANERDRAQTQKRGGGARSTAWRLARCRGPFFSWNRAPMKHRERIFEREWALILLDNAIQVLQTEMASTDEAVISRSSRHFSG